MKIKIECCEGTEKYKDQCLKTRCPIYYKAQVNVNASWPYVGTGYGNLYGEPNHGIYLNRVRDILQVRRKKA